MENPYAYSHLGYRYQENQDSFLILTKEDTVFLAVADGLGGHRSGKLASQKALERLEREFDHFPLVSEEVGKLLVAANEEVYQLDQEEERKPATTLSFVWLQGGEFYIGHVGDSRVYLYHQGELNLLTQDQSAVAEMMEKGQWVPLRYQERYGHILARTIGTKKEIPLNEDVFSYILGPYPLPQEGWLLLTTDGLTKHLQDEELEKVFQEGEKESAKTLAHILIDKALNLGGKDNITVILKKIKEENK